MKTRIITALVCTALLLAVLFAPWPVLLTFCVSAICGIGVYEVLCVTGMAKQRGLKIAAIAFALVAPFFTRFPQPVIFLICMTYALVLVLLQLVYHKTLPLDKWGGTVLLSILISLSLSCIAYLRIAGQTDSDGLFYIFLSLGIAWFSDIGAYFVGTFFGKHKLCPKLSPKKTVEGLIGGFISSIVGSLLIGLVYERVFLQGAAVSYWTILVLALIGAPLSVIGDLFASLIKRRCEVKDFGHLFPGHGGVMDRFDSLLFVLPMVFFSVRYVIVY